MHERLEVAGQFVDGDITVVGRVQAHLLRARCRRRRRGAAKRGRAIGHGRQSRTRAHVLAVVRQWPIGIRLYHPETGRLMQPTIRPVRFQRQPAAIVGQRPKINGRRTIVVQPPILHSIYYHMVCACGRRVAVLPIIATAWHDQMVLEHARSAGAGEAGLAVATVRPVHGQPHIFGRLAGHRITALLRDVAMAMVQRSANRLEYRFTEYCNQLAAQMLRFHFVAMLEMGLLLDAAVIGAFVALAGAAVVSCPPKSTVQRVFWVAARIATVAGAIATFWSEYRSGHLHLVRGSESACIV